MPEALTAKSGASTEQRLRYLEQLGSTKIGLQNANFALITRRSMASIEESRQIDIDVSQNKAEYAKMSAAYVLYFAQDVKFRPPTQTEFDAVEAEVEKIDRIVVANDKASKIMASATALIQAFKSTQA
ncbi:MULTISPECIES: hypothetical protein [unclassified Variovorax]|uniref:hypothetical protein n=1 Tax=unclassified Variovorax TaxID=663243 RepID=UPI003F44B707